VGVGLRVRQLSRKISRHDQIAQGAAPGESARDITAVPDTSNLELHLRRFKYGP
jgi:hypothetical protein